VENGAGSELWWSYEERIRALANQADALRRERNGAVRRLEERCLKEHGSHQDDGGMFEGRCVRCGALLG